MGADIHTYIEYRKKLTDETDEHAKNWRCFGGRINPGRNYWLFGLMAQGVSSNFKEGKPAKGLPKDIGYVAFDDLTLWISDNPENNEEGSTSLETAKEWESSYGCKITNDSEGKPRWVENPDWHTHSWLTTQEFAEVLEMYKEKAKQDNIDQLAKHKEKLAIWKDEGKVGDKEYKDFIDSEIKFLEKVIETGVYDEPQYEAIFAVMKRLEEMGYEVRLVFWFDN
jgi:hypothetical protein